MTLNAVLAQSLPNYRIVFEEFFGALVVRAHCATLNRESVMCPRSLSSANLDQTRYHLRSRAPVRPTSTATRLNRPMPHHYRNLAEHLSMLPSSAWWAFGAIFAISVIVVVWAVNSKRPARRSKRAPEQRSGHLKKRAASKKRSRR